ncbi:xanthine dehydrogenase family protein subunit M [Aquabacter sp. L1I39]|uniref:FAD binding domain-containing protein n=1 Tax=Aquabacter sp. L1I39 TaxID=2820278 RepID=UPI001ADAFBFC|nr:xanthine dehydrogenase family protein subunit M [Aquabacter sp. L1I39]QTL03890.1 xanthine dehydrogenase family protein subunit M [Aquabacter sp. L1I39]
MKARAFTYVRARSLEEAVTRFGEADGEASYISGGQSLVPALALRLQAPAVIIDLAGIATLRGVMLEDGALRIGALTRHADVLTHPLIGAHAPLLREAAPHVAHPAIRNRGTIGGNIALADPASEFPAMLLAIDARVEIFGPAGFRQVPADDYFLDLYQTAAEPGEIVTAILVPPAPPGTVIAMDELARRRGDYAMVGAGLQGRFSTDRTVEALRIAFFSVGATPVRAKGAETAVIGNALDAVAIAKAQRALDDDLDPMDDEEVPAAMRRHLARVLLGRLLQRMRDKT